MVSLGETGRVIRDFTCAKAFGDGILPVAVPTVNDIIHQDHERCLWPHGQCLGPSGGRDGCVVFISDFCA